MFATYNFKCNSFNEIKIEIEVEIEIANDIEIPAQNTQLRQFWSKIWGFLFLDEIFCLEKFESADVK